MNPPMTRSLCWLVLCVPQKWVIDGESTSIWRSETDSTCCAGHREYSSLVQDDWVPSQYTKRHSLEQGVHSIGVEADCHLKNGGGGIKITVSQKTTQLWNGVARNFKDRFGLYLAEIFKGLQNRDCMFQFSCTFAFYQLFVFQIGHWK